MKIDKKTIDLLSRLGLNKYEIDAYVALVSAGKITASELSSASGIPGARVYDIMDSLEKKGFVLIGIGRPTTYQAVAPKEAFSDYKERLRREHKRGLRKFDTNVRTILGALTPLWEKELTFKKPHEVFSVREDEDIPVMVDKVLRRAGSDIYMLTDKCIASFTVTEFIDDLEEAANRKISIKSLLPPEIEESVITRLSKVSSMRTVKEPPCSFWLTDRSNLLLIQRFNDFSEEVKGIALWTNSSLITAIFGWLFDRTWESAKAYKSRSTG